MEHGFPLKSGRLWSPQERWIVSLFGRSLNAVKAGNSEQAQFLAALCLGALGGPRSNSSITAGATETVDGQEVHLPDHLHYHTALQRFEDTGILTKEEAALISAAF